MGNPGEVLFRSMILDLLPWSDDRSKITTEDCRSGQLTEHPRTRPNRQCEEGASPE